MSLNGLEPDSKSGLIKATYLTSLPSWYQTGTWKEPEATAWYKTLVKYLNGPPGNNDPTKTTNIDTTSLWNSRDQALPPDGSGKISWGLATIAALSEFVTPKQAAAITQWLGGAYQYKGVFGLSRNAYDMSDFLDAGSCYGYEDPTIKISDALEALKSKNKAAHDWVVRAAAAKAAKKAVHEATMYNKTIEAEKKVVAKAVEKTAEGVAEVAKGAGEAITDAFSLTAFLLKYGWYIAGGVVVVGGYIAWKNRGTIAKVAAGAAIGGPAGAAAALSKNPKKRRRLR